MRTARADPPENAQPEIAPLENAPSANVSPERVEGPRRVAAEKVLMNNSSIVVFILAVVVAAPAVSAPGPAEAADDAATSGDAEASGDELAQIEDEDAAAEIASDAIDAMGEDDEDDDEIDWPFSWSIGTGLTSSAGNVFRQDLPITERDESVLNTWSFGISKEFVDGLSGSLGWGFYKYLTTAGGTNFEREARINDLSVSLTYGPIYTIPVLDVSISASLGAVVPLSRMSRTSTLRTRLSPRLSFGRSFGNLSLSYGFGGSKSFHEFTSPVVDATDVDAIRRDGGAEDISANEVALAGVNSEWSISHSIGLSYQWVDNFSTSLSWGYGKSWGYDVTDCDELSSEFARCDGRIPRDSMTGSISANYLLRDHYSFTLAAMTAQRPKTADNRRFNFPFWDIQTPGLFNTQLSFDFGVSF